MIPAVVDIELLDDDRTVVCEQRAFRLGDLLVAARVVDLDRPDLERALTNLPPDVAVEIGPFDPALFALAFEDHDRTTLIGRSSVGQGFEIVEYRRDVDGWSFEGWDGVADCTLEVALPDGLDEVEWEFQDGPPGADVSSFTVLATEVGCASGRDPGDQLLGPQVVENTDEIRIAFAVIPPGDAECPENPSTAVTIELDAPVGDRSIIEGRSLGIRLSEVLPAL